MFVVCSRKDQICHLYMKEKEPQRKQRRYFPITNTYKYEMLLIIYLRTLKISTNIVKPSPPIGWVMKPI